MTLFDVHVEERTQAPERIAVRRLMLSYFRNYVGLSVDFDGRSVVLTGSNGSGKTNLLEAVSFLAPGRGLRRASAADLAHEQGPGHWAVSARLEGPLGEVDIGTGIEAMPAGDDAPARAVRIDRVPQKSSNALAAYAAVLWLTPDMDGLFRGPAGDRRRFLDRLALGLDPEHGTRVSTLERLNRSRNRLLEDLAPDTRWLGAIEQDIAATAIAAVSTRLETIDRLQAVIMAHRDDASPFPHAELRLEGELEDLLRSSNAGEAEDVYRANLAALRPRDAAAGRATMGPQTSDLIVIHGPKGMPASRASTGEQKALLTGLVLAQARLLSVTTGRLPLLLLDEIAAHLDEMRRAGLFEELDQLGCQCFMTGTDPDMFKSMQGRAQFFEVARGHVSLKAD